MADENEQVEGFMKESPKSKRRDKDNYPTPAPLARWAVGRAMTLIKPIIAEFDPMLMLEPGCGDSQPFAVAMAELAIPFKRINVIAVDIREDDGEEKDANLAELHDKGIIKTIRGKDFLTGEGRSAVGNMADNFCLIATNPPYNQAEAFIRKSLELLAPTGVAVFLLRLSFLSTQGRIPLFNERPPAEVHVLQKRPSFVNGRSDNSEYAFFLWLGDALDGHVRTTMRGETSLHWLDNRDWK